MFFRDEHGPAPNAVSSSTSSHRGAVRRKERTGVSAERPVGGALNSAICCSYDNDAAAADNGEFPKYVCTKRSRLKTCPKPTAGLMLMKSSRFM